MPRNCPSPVRVRLHTRRGMSGWGFVGPSPCLSRPPTSQVYFAASSSPDMNASARSSMLPLGNDLREGGVGGERGVHRGDGAEGGVGVR